MSRTSALRPSRIAAIVLAAGGSTRLGRPKQLLRLRGKSLLIRSAHLGRRAVAGPVVIVLGHERQRLRSLLHREAPGVRIAVNTRWREGLSTSLRAGIRSLPPGTAAALILLVDQPDIGLADLVRLVDRARRRPTQPAAAFYRGRARVPAVFPRRWFDRLVDLDGDRGARDLLAGLPPDARVAMPSAEFDIDTPADAAGLGATRQGRTLSGN